MLLLVVLWGHSCRISNTSAGRNRSRRQRLTHSLLDVTLVVATTHEPLATLFARKGPFAGVDSSMNGQLPPLSKAFVAEFALILLFTRMRRNVLGQRRRRRQLPATNLARVLLVLFALRSDVHRGRDLLRVRNVQLALGVKVHIVVPPHLVLVDEALLAEDAGVRSFARMKSRMNRKRSLLGERLAADVTHERNRNLSVVLHVTLQVLQVFKDPIAHLTGHYSRQSVLKFVLHDAFRVSEGQIAVPALGFRNFRFVLGLDVLHRDG